MTMPCLEELRNRIADIGAEDDGKLARLREFLEGNYYQRDKSA